jgi:hypothetical protein
MYVGSVYVQNAEGKTALHIAIENQHPIISSLLLAHPNINLALRDKQSQTAFTAAMKVKSIKTAQIILSRQPAAAEQVTLGSRSRVVSGYCKVAQGQGRLVCVVERWKRAEFLACGSAEE